MVWTIQGWFLQEGKRDKDEDEDDTAASLLRLLVDGRPRLVASFTVKHSSYSCMYWSEMDDREETLPMQCAHVPMLAMYYYVILYS